MSERKPIGKGMRFDIFRRDTFTCRYCGRRPPDVVLEVDHLVAVAEGGDNEETNLITSCQDCNRGKRTKPITKIPAGDVDPAYLEIQQEVAEMQRYLAAKKIRDAQMQKVIHELAVTWQEAAGVDWYFLATADWVRIFGPELVERALLVVAPKWRGGKFRSELDAVKYTRGVLNTMAER